MDSKQNAIFYIILPLILVACGMLWLWQVYPVTHVPSNDGTRDLRSADFDFGSFDLYGPVEYIPNALLTPKEFEARQSEIQVGEPAKTAKYSTSRLRIYVPEGSYGLMLVNAEYATNIYIGGELMESVGVPASDSEYSTPGVKLLYYTVEATYGVIEIVQQASTYVLPEGISHTDIIIGRPDIVRKIYDKQKTIPSVLMGCFLALALAHLALHFLLRFYKANLWFALFCFAWFLRTGYTYPYVLSSLFPFSWSVVFRLCCLTYPAGLLLLCLTLHTLFPGVLQKWFRIALNAVCGGFACVCLFADTVLLADALPHFYIVIFLSVAYILVRLCLKLRKPNVEQLIVLIGMGVFLCGVLRDILYFETIPALLSTEPVMSELTQQTLAEYTLLVFVFFQMVAMFHGTMREITEVKEAEQRLAIENAALDRVSKLKTEMMQTLTHELRTPLAIMSTYAQLTIQDIREDSLGKQTIDDIQVIREEAERLADMATDFLDVFREQEKTHGRKAVDIGVLLCQIGRLCAPIVKKKNNRLRVDAPEDLPRVQGNVDELTQVMHNLITNANNYTQNGEITIDASIVQSDGMVEVLISDTGEGVAQELLPYVFERHTTCGDGAGLGLSICREIIDSHGGGIEIDSKPGKGTKVRFTLPIIEGGEDDGGESDNIGGGRQHADA